MKLSVGDRVEWIVHGMPGSGIIMVNSPYWANPRWVRVRTPDERTWIIPDSAIRKPEANPTVSDPDANNFTVTDPLPAERPVEPDKTIPSPIRYDDSPADDLFNVTLTLYCERDDGLASPFSRTTTKSYGLTRRQFHAYQRAISDLLLSFGDAAVAAHDVLPNCPDCSSPNTFLSGDWYRCAACGNAWKAADAGAK